MLSHITRSYKEGVVDIKQTGCLGSQEDSRLLLFTGRPGSCVKIILVCHSIRASYSTGARIRDLARVTQDTKIAAGLRNLPTLERAE